MHARRGDRRHERRQELRGPYALVLVLVVHHGEQADEIADMQQPPRHGKRGGVDAQHVDEIRQELFGLAGSRPVRRAARRPPPYFEGTTRLLYRLARSAVALRRSRTDRPANWSPRNPAAPAMPSSSDPITLGIVGDGGDRGWQWRVLSVQDGEGERQVDPVGEKPAAWAPGVARVTSVARVAGVAGISRVPSHC